jgi:hypothetical protein
MGALEVWYLVWYLEKASGPDLVWYLEKASGPELLRQLRLVWN